jgi:hypothetical protein
MFPHSFGTLVATSYHIWWDASFWERGCSALEGEVNLTRLNCGSDLYGNGLALSATIVIRMLSNQLPSAPCDTT